MRAWLLVMGIVGGLAGNLVVPEAEAQTENAVAGRWESAARLDAPRSGLGVVVHEGKLYAAGGSGLTVPHADFESYDAGLDRWLPETPLPRGLEQFGMAALGGRIYVAGGYAPDGEGQVGPSAGVWSWSPMGHVWQSEAAMPSAKADVSLVALDGRLYAVGGLTDDGQMHVFDAEARSWDSIDIPAGVTRRAAAVAALDGRLYVLGGRDDAGTSDRVDVYDPVTDSWESGPVLPEARSGSAVAVHAGRLHVLGGRSADARTTLQTHLSWTPGEASWHREADLPSPRTGAEAAVLEGGIYLVGGGTGGGFLAPFTAIDSTDVFVKEAS
ncbi:Kelch repeat-containing protein [Maricaulis sp. CAU 1757]